MKMKSSSENEEVQTSKRKVNNVKVVIGRNTAEKTHQKQPIKLTMSG